MAKSHRRVPEIGRPAKADFLPPQIKYLHEGRKIRHNLAVTAVVVAVVCASAQAYITTFEASSHHALDAARARSQAILDRQSGYSDMVSLVQESAALSAAYVVASERNVLFSQLFARVQKSLPVGGSINSMQLHSVAASGSSTAADALVTLNISFRSPAINQVEFFLLDAEQWPGYVSGTINQLTNRNGYYDAEAVINFGVDALTPGAPQGVLSIGGGK